MDRIYLDNAATSFPKPPQVWEAVCHAAQLGAPAGRGSYAQALEVDRLVESARRQLASLLGTRDASRVVFTSNGTHALNLALHGLLRPGDHVVTTELEHNSVLRPLRFLQRREVRVSYVAPDASGQVPVDGVAAAIRPETRLIALTHASNVTGALQPVPAICQLARERGVWTLVDAAQSVGHVPLNPATLGVDLLAASGHKGLLGPLGTGFLWVREGLEGQLEPLMQGGTGTESDSEDQPTSMPGRYEAGNQNAPALAGLAAALEFLADQSLAAIRRQQVEQTGLLLDHLQRIAGLQLYGPQDPEQRVGVVSFSLPAFDPREVAAMLDAAHGIQVRAGFHCAPRIHRLLGTDRRGGTVRLSPGAFTTTDQLLRTVDCIGELAAIEA